MLINFYFYFLGRLAKKLLDKFKSHAKQEPVDDEKYKQKERLKKILETHKESFNDKLFEEIIEWKNEKH